MVLTSLVTVVLLCLPQEPSATAAIIAMMGFAFMWAAFCYAPCKCQEDFFEKSATSRPFLRHFSRRNRTGFHAEKKSVRGIGVPISDIAGRGITDEGNADTETGGQRGCAVESLPGSPVRQVGAAADPIVHIRGREVSAESEIGHLRSAGTMRGTELLPWDAMRGSIEKMYSE